MRILLSALLLSILAIPAYAADNGSVYDRVIKSGTIRCGYILYPPSMIKDPQTGALSGVFYDYMNEMGKKLSLKIDWVQEAGWGTFINDLKSDRYDMLCSAVWTNSARGREATATKSLYYSTITAWTKAGDTRLDKNIKALNDPKYTIATIDGETADFLAKSQFPKAKTSSLPETAAVSDLFLNVTTGKADATFAETYLARQFLENNANSLKSVGAPLAIYGNAMWVKKGQEDFLTMINNATDEILTSDYVETTLKKYNVPDKSFNLPALPYREN